MNFTRDERAKLLKEAQEPSLDLSPKDDAELNLIKALQDLEEIDKPAAGVDPNPMTLERLEPMLWRKMADAVSGRICVSTVAAVAEAMKGMAWGRLAEQVKRLADLAAEHAKKEA